jgi:hypothetical protein
VKALFIGDMDLRSWNRRDERRTLSPLTNIFGLHRVECLYRGNSLFDFVDETAVGAIRSRQCNRHCGLEFFANSGKAIAPEPKPQQEDRGRPG